MDDAASDSGSDEGAGEDIGREVFSSPQAGPAPHKTRPICDRLYPELVVVRGDHGDDGEDLRGVTGGEGAPAEWLEGVFPLFGRRPCTPDDSRENRRDHAGRDQAGGEAVDADRLRLRIMP